MARRPPSIPAAPAMVSRRAAGALDTMLAAAPALAAELAAKMSGRSRRASCQTGTAVWAMRPAVYVASGMPSSAAAPLATAPARGNRPVHAEPAATVVAAPENARFHAPTLIGEVTLNTRSMYRKRLGIPRSLISSTGLLSAPASEIAHARRASSPSSARSARKARPADAPASPPVKKYHGISGFQMGSLMTGWP